MSGEKIKIRLARFEATKPLAHDVFLHLERNARYVCLVRAGGEFSPEMLARMASKAIEFLHLAAESQPNVDPETVALYLTDPASPGAATAATTVTGGETLNVDGAVKIAASATSVEPTQTFSADAPGTQPETRIAGGDQTSPETETIIQATAEPPPEEMVFSSQAALEGEAQDLLKRLRAAIIGEKLSAAAEAMLKEVTDSAVKERRKFRRDHTALAESFDRVSTSQVDVSLERRFPIDAEMTEFKSLGTPEASADLMMKASDRMVSAMKVLDAGRNHVLTTEKLITEAEAFRESKSLHKLEKMLVEPIVIETAEAKEELLQNVKNTLIVNKISEEIIKFSSTQEKEEEQHFAPELASLERALETISAGDALPKEVEMRFASDKEAEALVTVFANKQEAQKAAEHLQLVASKRDQAIDELDKQRNDGGLVRAKSHRDLPATASRLAAYLGYSLGYSNLDLLSDLALIAILHFAKRDEGVRLSDEPLAPFVNRVLNEKNPQHEDFVITDAQEIIQVLDAYLDNPECDREQKDFVKRVFDRTVESLTEDAVVIDGINLEKWAKFVEKGADLTGHSICVKAAANAIKQSRSIII